MSHAVPDMEAVSTMKVVLQDSLDELLSMRTSTSRVGEVISELEHFLAELCVPKTEEATERLRVFVKLQDSFECNVPSRVLSWMSTALSQLEHAISKASADPERKNDVSVLSAQLISTLSIIQGVTLLHAGSKRFLGRRYALEVLLDLLLTSRHVSPMPVTTTTDTPTPSSSPKSGENSSRNQTPNISAISLASSVLDTLLCVLVDSSPALRVFEDLNGVQVVVRILKRAGTPREVRMKCLEFLYFYLLDETTSVSSSDTPSDTSTSSITSSPTSPSDRSRPYHQALPSTSTSGFRDTSGSSTSSIFLSTSSASTSATSASSAQSTPRAPLEFKFPPIEPTASSSSTPIKLQAGIQSLAPSPCIITPPSHRAQPRNLLMLRKDVDYTPLSPKKASISRLGVSGSRSTSSTLRGKARAPRTKMDVLSSEDTDADEGPQTRRQGASGHSRGSSVSVHSGLSSVLSSPEAQKTPLASSRHRRAQSSADVLVASTTPAPVQPNRATSAAACLQTVSENRIGTARTMEEKKEILGSMLGNVDALVEGVRKAGIWGLG